MSPSSRILLIEDDAQIAAALEGVLTGEGYEVLQAADGLTGFEAASAGRCELVLTDLRLPGLSGIDVIRKLRTVRPKLPVILMTAHGTTETAIEATKLGAYDYIVKPFEIPELLAGVARALASSRLMSETLDLGAAASRRDAIVGRSGAMQAVYKEIGRIAEKPVNVLIRGETGTGKELIARAIYQHSKRSAMPFVAVNCAAIPEALLESELFGHERGAFTGADSRRIGRFEQAHKGTLFLDEIGDMSMSTQAKLLRVIQENTIQRLGGSEAIQVDVRIIAATNRDLEGGIVDREFREDLFYRLNVATLHLPPLRERLDDIAELARYFLARYASDFGSTTASIEPEALALLQRQPWPGNVRELENVIRRALIEARGYGITAKEIAGTLAGARKPVAAAAPLAEFVAQLLAAAARGELKEVHAFLVETAERELVTQAIRLAEGNQSKAAGWLGLSRLTLRAKLKQFGVHPAQEEAEKGAMIALVFALPEESSDLRKLVADAVSTGRGATLTVRGRLAGHEVAIAHTGVGEEAASAGMRRLLEELQPALVIGSGFAGGLQEGIEVGDVICDLRGETLPPEAVAGLRHGRIATAERALETPADKAEFGRRTGALAVDMESAAGARVCAEAGVRFIAVRAISDPVSAPLPVPMEHWFDLARQGPRPAGLLLFLARNPSRIRPFVRFVRGLAQPRAALARTLSQLVQRLAPAGVDAARSAQ